MAFENLKANTLDLAADTADTLTAVKENAVQAIGNTFSKLKGSTGKTIGKYAIGAVAAFGVVVPASAVLAPTPAYASANTVDPDADQDTEVTSTETTTEVIEQEKIVTDLVASTEATLIQEGATADEAKWIANTNAINWFKTAEAQDTAEQITQQEISPEVEAKLQEIGLTKEDVTIVTDVNAILPGPREAGINSMNHGKVVNTVLEGQKQTLDILNGRNGFTQKDAEVATEALRNAGYTDEMIEMRKNGDVTGLNLQVTYVSLNSDSANYHNIAMNVNGVLGYDSLRSVGQNDTIAIVTATSNTVEGAQADIPQNQVSYASRLECSGGELQPFEKVSIPQPEAPTPTPEAPVSPPAEPIPQTFKASYCAGIVNGVPDIKEVTGFATQEEADTEAERLEQECEAEGTTTTTTTPSTTTSTAPTTSSSTTTSSTTTSSTTTTSTPSTTTTIDDKETTTTVVQPTDPPQTTIDNSTPSSRPPATVSDASASTDTSIPEMIANGVADASETAVTSQEAQAGFLGVGGLFLALKRRRNTLRKRVA